MQTFIISPPTGKDDSLFFQFRVVHEESEANLKFVEEQVFFALPSVSAKPNKSARTIKFQCVQNVKPIDVGDELVLFRPKPQKAEKQQKRVLASLEARPSKSQKVS